MLFRLFLLAAVTVYFSVFISCTEIVTSASSSSSSSSSSNSSRVFTKSKSKSAATAISSPEESSTQPSTTSSGCADSNSSTELDCEENEIINKCPNLCEDDYCPTSEVDERSCDLFDPNPNFCPPPECRCRFNYKRADNGTCIPTRSCPPFDCSARPNEEYNPCPPYCPSDDCSQATPKGGCHIFGRIGIVLQCKPKCRCIEGYWRKDGICVPYDQCPGICPPNEEFSNCIQAVCRAQNCSEKGQSVACPDMPEGSCLSGCVCKKGTLRTENGTCIPEDHCPTELKCSDDEVVENCPTGCSDDSCPTSGDESKNCSSTGACLPPQCRCRFNYKRAKNGTCIPTRNCPPFNCSTRPNEEYNPCPPLCPTDDCSQASPTGRCPLGRIGIILECNPKCRCIEGYWRKDGICVPYEECPGKCSINEEFSNCTQALCRPQNCSQVLTKSTSVSCPNVTEEGSCSSGCVCKEGTLRAKNGTCIPEDQCPTELQCGDDEVVDNCPTGCSDDSCPTSGDESKNCSSTGACLPPQCRCRFNYKRAKNGTCMPTRNCPPFNCSTRPNEEYNPCPPLCPTDDCSQASPTGRCPLGRIGIILECNPKCRCIEGYWRKDGICVPYEKCPGKCPNNEEFSNCTQALCRPQNCSQILPTSTSVLCHNVTEGSCESGCVCKEGTLRAKNGTCVSEDECRKPDCGDNEVSDDCPNDCVSDYCPKNEKEYDDCSPLDVCPPPECRCSFNYKRADNGTCIPTKACPPFDCSARPNEEYDPCPPLCPTDDCSQASPSGECPPLFGFIGIVLECNPACRCIKGYWRKDGICVPYAECPGVCGPNEEFSNCTQDSCRAQNCSQIGQPVVCEVADGLQKCICKDGFLKNDNGTCVPKDECRTVICPPNEEFSECTQGVCRALNCSQYMQSVPCPDLAEGSCEKGCVCVEGTLRADNGTCIPENQCETALQCGSNEVSACVKECPPETTCRTRGIMYKCLDDGKKCQQKCICKEGYYRNAVGECISDADCDKCTKDNEYFSCSVECDNVCSELHIQNKTNCPIVNIVCNPKCYCDDGYARDDKKNCVPIEKCPMNNCQCTGPNEEYTECKQTCPPDTCLSFVAKFNCATEPPCMPGCVCKSGFWRQKEGAPCMPKCDCKELASTPECQNE